MTKRRKKKEVKNFMTHYFREIIKYNLLILFLGKYPSLKMSDDQQLACRRYSNCYPSVGQTRFESKIRVCKTEWFIRTRKSDSRNIKTGD
jgi:hypothetical protein